MDNHKHKRNDEDDYPALKRVGSGRYNTLQEGGEEQLKRDLEHERTEDF